MLRIRNCYSSQGARTRGASTRGPWRALAAAGAIAVLSGCGQSGLLLDGIGSTAYVKGETEKRVVNADSYFAAMCRRADLGDETGGTESRRCALATNSPKWNDVVVAALNDVDERCSAYLSTLDHARRDRTLYTRNMRDVTQTTKIVLGIIEPGPKALAIVETLFGYAQSTLDTYYSRLILETEKGAAERLVAKLQVAYRRLLFTQLVRTDRNGNSTTINVVDGSVGAYYAVRGYLRLCLPMTIESEINSTISMVGYFGDNRFTENSLTPILASVKVVPLVPAFSASPSPATNGTPPKQPPPDNQPKQPPPPVERAINPHPSSAVETDLSRADGEKLQRALCVAPQTGDLGGTNSDNRTRRAIAWYYAANGKTAAFLLNKADASAILQSGSCFTTAGTQPPLRVRQNAYERFKFVTERNVESLHTRLSGYFRVRKGEQPNLAVEPEFLTAAFSDRKVIGEITRRAIRRAREIANVVVEAGEEPDGMTPALYLKIGG